MGFDNPCYCSTAAFQHLLENFNFSNAKKSSYVSCIKSSRFIQVQSPSSHIFPMGHLVICIHLTGNTFHTMSSGDPREPVITLVARLNVFSSSKLSWNNMVVLSSCFLPQVIASPSITIFRQGTDPKITLFVFSSHRRIPVSSIRFRGNAPMVCHFHWFGLQTPAVPFLFPFEVFFRNQEHSSAIYPLDLGVC